MGSSDGVSTLKLISDKEYPTSYEEDELKEFTLSHSEFFYLSGEGPRRAYLDVLWGRITEFLELWRRTKANDYWAAGRAMKEALSAAGLASPEWPRPPKRQPKPAQKARSNDLDDDIPF